MILEGAKFVALHDNQYVRTKYPKTQIVLHHTAGTHNARAVVLAHWNSNVERVATPYIIDNKGGIVQCYDDEYYAYGLYVRAPGNDVHIKYKRNDEVLNRCNIGIELTNAGYLTKDGDVYKPWFPKKVFKQEEIFELEFREKRYWEPYYEPQIGSLKGLLARLLSVNPIIKEGFVNQNLDEIWDINYKALTAQPGIYTHCCYRTDKTDVYPYPPLIAMLQDLQATCKKGA